MNVVFKKGSMPELTEKQYLQNNNSRTLSKKQSLKNNKIISSEYSSCIRSNAFAGISFRAISAGAVNPKTENLVKEFSSIINAAIDSNVILEADMNSIRALAEDMVDHSDKKRVVFLLGEANNYVLKKMAKNHCIDKTPIILDERYKKITIPKTEEDYDIKKMKTHIKELLIGNDKIKIPSFDEENKILVYHKIPVYTPYPGGILVVATNYVDSLSDGFKILIGSKKDKLSKNAQLIINNDASEAEIMDVLTQIIGVMSENIPTICKNSKK